VAAQEEFKVTVIDPLQVNVGGRVLPYREYLKLPATSRSNDEAAVVDQQFTTKLLEWLGYDQGDVVYNRPTLGRPQDKPDFAVNILGSTAFIVEDKSTDERFDETSVKQLRRYTAGTSGYCLWTNGRSLIGLRFDPNGQYTLLVDVRVDAAFGEQQSLFDQGANFDILGLLFRKQRFAEVSAHIKAITISEQEWQQQAQPLTDDASLRAFISASRFVLDQLATAVRARLTSVDIELAEAADHIAASRQRYAELVSTMLRDLTNVVPPDALVDLGTKLRVFEIVLADLDLGQIERLKLDTSGATAATAFSAGARNPEVVWTEFVREVTALISALRERELTRSEFRRIRAAYLVWRERYKIIEDAGDEATVETRRQTAFAEQVSYVFFVRLLLARVLEDKGIMPRLISDGGFSAWHGFLKQYATDNIDEIRSESFLPLVYRRVAGFYKHFFQQPVFDWFLPDDYLVALVLERLSRYDFKDVTSDLLGFTYEAFIDRTARNQKGHFLTPPPIVEYMLDRAGYDSTAIIGERLLDTSCGSGSFLVHGARRLRGVLAARMAEADPAELARAFIDRVTTDLVGLEINPFSCYLAELNLFIQVLDDLALLWRAGERHNVERFSIYNTNSLEMPQVVLYDTAALIADDSAALDEAASIKALHGQFGYVICNPPYVNRGIILGAKSYGDFPFYKSVVKGDENFYLLFLRLASYYAAPGGTVCFICPLNLLGDESTTRARDMFGGPQWSIHSLTRFYVRNVLFPGVLQGVNVVRFDRRSSQPTDLIEIRGGDSVDDAAGTAIRVEKSRITSNYPSLTAWTSVKPWLVNANVEVYNLWEHVRSGAKTVLDEVIDRKIDVGKGDVRSTWTKPLIAASAGHKLVPLTKGKRIVDWGGWSAESYVDPGAKIPSGIKDYKSSLWVQKRVERIANLPRPEVALLLKEVSGLEMKRPIRGTIIERDAQHPVVADETLLVMYTLDPAHTDLAHAVFGLVTSAAYNFLFSLFSTNPHANYREILRLPVPLWTPDLERRLAEQTRETLNAHARLHKHIEEFGAGHDRHRAGIPDVLRALGLPTLSLEDMRLRQDVVMTGSETRKLQVLLDAGQLRPADTLDPDATTATELVLHAHGSLSYANGGKDVRIPSPKVAPTFVAQLHAIEEERAQRIAAIGASHGKLDEIVFDAYGIKVPAWRQILDAGVPWAKS